MDEFKYGKKSLELCCYVIGGGAFSVFLRWLQNQRAFNELGLPEKSALHVFLVLFFVAAAVVFLHFINRFEKQHMALPDDFPAAFENSGRLYLAVRIVAGVIICAGAVLLFMQTETDKNSTDYRVLSLLGGLSGICLPLWFSFANRETQPAPGILCALSFVPMLWMAAWLVIIYKTNTINSVIWQFFPEMVTVAVTMLAFFRLGGYVFGRPRWKLTLFGCMMAGLFCIMTLADERFLGMQIMFLGAALMNLFATWVIVKNLQKKDVPKAAPRKETTGGFETL
ncbi:MAG: hypothetical protein J5949_04425 [Oscillospiraceae bacterium]|nr:hypothetical protein [Oscillospiraceae bacterium]